MTRTTTQPAGIPVRRERPVLFSGPMVRAILAGRKTQTRRLVKPQPKVVHAIHPDASLTTDCIFPKGDQRIHCPYGAPGDRLWVRETWGDADIFYQGHTNDEPGVVAYRADQSALRFHGVVENPDPVPDYDRATWNWNAIKWRPSIFMPRWASRLTLEVTEVRVQRVQDISDADIAAEGVTAEAVRDLLRASDPTRKEWGTPTGPGFTPHVLWELGWRCINGDAAWDANPWVWCISFRNLPADEVRALR